MENKFTSCDGDYICVKAVGSGTQIIGLTRGEETKSRHTENLDQGEVLLMQFTENVAAIKVRGNAEVYTKYGRIEVKK